MASRSLPSKHMWRNLFFVALCMLFVLGSIKVVANANTMSATLGGVTAARQDALYESDNQFAAQLTALQQAGIIVKELAKSKVDVCYTDHNDQGWIVTSWYQNCYLRYVSGYTTAQSKQAILAKLTSLAALFGTPQTSTYDQSVSPCDLAEANFIKTILYRPAMITAHTNNGCDIPDPIQDVSTSPDPVLDSQNQMSVKRFSSYDPATIDITQNQVWVIYNDSYYHQDLGCGLGLFCTNPRPHPVHAL